MADGKWISNLGAETPLAEAARRVLLVRLEVVRDALPPAVADGGRDPEHVHQLRVATRRADAAVKMFRDCLPDKVYRSVRRRLRRVRRAAGAARDWDVFLLELSARLKGRAAKEVPGLGLLFGYALAERTAAGPALEAVGPDHDPGFEHFLTEAVVAVRPPPQGPGSPETLVDLARTLLSCLLNEMGQAAAGDLTDYAHLHQVRIAGKGLRYAMEVFADCFPPPFKENLYPRVEEVQEVLGLANDSHVAAGRLAELRVRLRTGPAAEWKRWQPGVEGLLRFHQRRLPQERRRFLKWWERWQKDGTSELAALLGGPSPPSPTGQVAVKKR